MPFYMEQKGYYHAEQLYNHVTHIEVYPMSWNIRWRVLADAVTDLRKSGEKIPANIVRDLRSAKTLIAIIETDKQRPEYISRLEECLSNVEAYVLPAFERKFGRERVESLLRGLSEIERRCVEAELETQARFHPGFPREKKWIRIQASDEIPLKVIKEIADKIGLEIKVQEDGYVLVCGKEEKVKTFIKRMASYVAGRSRLEV